MTAPSEKCSNLDCFRDGIYLSAPVLYAIGFILIFLAVAGIVICTIKRRRAILSSTSGKSKLLAANGMFTPPHHEAAPPYTPNDIPPTPAPLLQYPPPSYSPV